MTECIFCKIARHKIPADVVFEDENAIAFFPKEMEAYGHTLVIPKNHRENIFDIDEQELALFAVSVQKVACLLKKVLKADGINILNANGKSAEQSIFHLHFHLIPRFEKDGLETWPKLPKNHFDKEKLLELFK